MGCSGGSLIAPYSAGVMVVVAVVPYSNGVGHCCSDPTHNTLVDCGWTDASFHYYYRAWDLVVGQECLSTFRFY